MINTTGRKSISGIDCDGLRYRLESTSGKKLKIKIPIGIDLIALVISNLLVSKSAQTVKNGLMADVAFDESPQGETATVKIAGLFNPSFAVYHICVTGQ